MFEYVHELFEINCLNKSFMFEKSNLPKSVNFDWNDGSIKITCYVSVLCVI